MNSNGDYMTECYDRISYDKGYQQGMYAAVYALENKIMLKAAENMGQFKAQELRDIFDQVKGEKKMKKLFVSVPMKGRETKDILTSIEKMKKAAELFEGEKLELIDSYVEDNPPKGIKESIWYLGKSVEKLSEADVFIGIFDDWKWNGCHIESDIASAYGIKSYFVKPEYVIQNYDELCRRKNEECVPCCEVRA